MGFHSRLLHCLGCRGAVKTNQSEHFQKKIDQDIDDSTILNKQQKYVILRKALQGLYLKINKKNKEFMLKN